jgi:mono/diheme cytochrome c family protein
MLNRCALPLLAFALTAQGHEVITTRITWTREISRLVYKNCISCHREGGSSFSLVNYEEARPWAKAIKEEVLARRMPPWNAVKGFGEFQDEKGLSQEQIQLVADWVEGGAPEGEKVLAPKPPRSFDTPSKRAAGVKLLVRGSAKLRTPTTLRGVLPGAIPKDGAIQVVARRPDGSIQPLLWVQKFNPAYNQPYWLKAPLKLPAGTVIETSPPTSSASLLIAAPAARPAASN